MSFKIFLEQSSCALSWTNKRHDLNLLFVPWTKVQFLGFPAHILVTILTSPSQLRWRMYWVILVTAQMMSWR